MSPNRRVAIHAALDRVIDLGDADEAGFRSIVADIGGDPAFEDLIAMFTSIAPKIAALLPRDRAEALVAEGQRQLADAMLGPSS